MIITDAATKKLDVKLIIKFMWSYAKKLCRHNRPGPIWL